MNAAPSPAQKQAIEQLLERSRLRQDELATYLAHAVDRAYWEKLNPALSVSGDLARDPLETNPIDVHQHDELVRKVATEGYFQTEPILSAPCVERMRRCVEVLHREGWPLVFSFVYDEFWLTVRTPSLVHLLSSVLGPGYLQIPNFWTHFVHPTRQARGWPPHVDGADHPNRLTVWIPLTDATLDNGCIYLVPRDRTPPRAAEVFGQSQTLDRKDLSILLQGTRALPARAGAILGWSFDVIHWGSLCTRPGEPRISISQEFIAANAPACQDEFPLLEGHPGLPTFAQRLHAIGRAIMAYERFEPLMIRFVEMAKQLVATIHPGANVRG